MPPRKKKEKEPPPATEPAGKEGDCAVPKQKGGPLSDLNQDGQEELPPVPVKTTTNKIKKVPESWEYDEDDIVDYEEEEEDFQFGIPPSSDEEREEADVNRSSATQTTTDKSSAAAPPPNRQHVKAPPAAAIGSSSQGPAPGTSSSLSSQAPAPTTMTSSSSAQVTNTDGHYSAIQNNPPAVARLEAMDRKIRVALWTKKLEGVVHTQMFTAAEVKDQLTLFISEVVKASAKDYKARFISKQEESRTFRLMLKSSRRLEYPLRLTNNKQHPVPSWFPIQLLMINEIEYSRNTQYLRIGRSRPIHTRSAEITAIFCSALAKMSHHHL